MKIEKFKNTEVGFFRRLSEFFEIENYNFENYGFSDSVFGKFVNNGFLVVSDKATKKQRERRRRRRRLEYNFVNLPKQAACRC